MQRQKSILRRDNRFLKPAKCPQKSTYFAFCCVSTRPQSCRSWIQVRGLLCRWSGPRSVKGSAVVPCFLWEGWAGRLGSGWPAGRSDSLAAAPGSWCNAWPDAGSRSCSASSLVDGWGWACGARRRRCWRCAGASAPLCWWTPSWSWCLELQRSVTRKWISCCFHCQCSCKLSVLSCSWHEWISGHFSTWKQSCRLMRVKQKKYSYY